MIHITRTQERRGEVCMIRGIREILCFQTERVASVVCCSAFALCAENRVPMVRVFGLDDPENLLRVLEGSDIGTFVHP